MNTSSIVLSHGWKVTATGFFYGMYEVLVFACIFFSFDNSAWTKGPLGTSNSSPTLVSATQNKRFIRLSVDVLKLAHCMSVHLLWTITIGEPVSRQFHEGEILILFVGNWIASVRNDRWKFLKEQRTCSWNPRPNGAMEWVGRGWKIGDRTRWD